MLYHVSCGCVSASTIRCAHTCPRRGLAAKAPGGNMLFAIPSVYQHCWLCARNPPGNRCD
eukprot:13660704-Alexandrium_andersonii.AAC.1